MIVYFPRMMYATLALAALVCASSPLWGQADRDLPPLNTAHVLRELEQVETKQREIAASRQRERSNILSDALGSGTAPGRLYEEAVRATQFAGRAKESSDFGAWSKKNADLLRSAEMRQAIQLHVRYLLLSLQRREVPSADLTSAVLQYANDLATANVEAPPGHLPREAGDLLNKPVSDGVFAKWLLPDEHLPDPKLWEPNAGNLAGILEKNVRAPLRGKNSPLVLQTWDLQIKALNDSAQNSANPVETGRIKSFALPAAIFGRATDRAALGQPNRAATEILHLLRTNPAHPDWPTWAEKLKELLDAGASGSGN